jgi:hypothetical protein
MQETSTITGAIKPIATQGDVKKLIQKTFDSMLTGEQKEENLKKTFPKLFQEIVRSVYEKLDIKNKSLSAFIKTVNTEHSQVRVNLLDRFTQMKNNLKN